MPGVHSEKNNKKKRVFVTVGTTQFDDLIAAAVSEQTQKALVSKGCVVASKISYKFPDIRQFYSKSAAASSPRLPPIASCPSNSSATSRPIKSPPTSPRPTWSLVTAAPALASKCYRRASRWSSS